MKTNEDKTFSFTLGATPRMRALFEKETGHRKPAYLDNKPDADYLKSFRLWALEKLYKPF